MRKRPIILASFLLFGTVLSIILIYGMLGWDVAASFTKWTGKGLIGEFIGFGNYAKWFTDRVLNEVFWNTLELLVIFLGGTILIGLVCASILNLGIKGEGALRMIYLIPLSISFVVSAAAWAWMFTPQHGIINSILRGVNLGFLAQPWTASTSQSLICVAIAYIWQFSGFATLIFYTGLRSVPQELIESAEISGASTFQKYRHIYWPMQGTATVSVLMILLIYILRVFALPWLLTGGGPGYSSEVLPLYLYRVTFLRLSFGYGASIGVLIAIISIAVALPILYRTLIRRGS